MWQKRQSLAEKLMYIQWNMTRFRLSFRLPLLPFAFHFLECFLFHSLFYHLLTHSFISLCFMIALLPCVDVELDFSSGNLWIADENWLCPNWMIFPFPPNWGLFFCSRWLNFFSCLIEWKFFKASYSKMGNWFFLTYVEK